MNIQTKKDSWIFLNFDYINSILDYNQRINITSLCDIDSDLVATNLVINKTKFLREFVTSNNNTKYKELGKFKAELILNYSNEFIDIFNDLIVVRMYNELFQKLKPVLENKI